MSQDTRIRFIFILIVTVALGYILLPLPHKPTFGVLEDVRIHLGIDLAGGAELRYRVLFPPGETNKQEKTLASTDIVRRRVEMRKLREPKITHQDDDLIIIQLAGVDRAGLEDYKRLIGEAGKLELFAAANKEAHERFNQDGRVPEGFKAWPHKESLRGEYDFIKDKILLKERPVITGRDISSASHSHEFRAAGGLAWVVNFQLTTDGAKLFDDAAKVLFNQRPQGLIAIVLDGEIISAPEVRAESFGGKGGISGNFTEKSALDLAIKLRSGSLPAPLGHYGPDGKPVHREPEAESFVGPTLGQDAIRRGLWSSGITLALVALFMIVYYRSIGFIAVVTLALNLVYLVGIMAFFGATLTLPGIAGIVLTVGMAVDANILIFERIREEQAKGKSASQAFEAGHERALSAIVDSNITTFLAALILYYFGTGPVQGFAVSLSIGILTTLFSVLFCGKTFLKMKIAGGLTRFRMMQLMAEPKLQFMRSAKTCVIASVLIVAAGTAFFVSRGARNFGIDFRGGSMLAFRFSVPQDIDFVRGTLQKIPGEGGFPKYPDAEVQTIADPDAPSAEVMFGRPQARSFQLRTSFEDVNRIKDDVQDAFKDLLSHEPFSDMPQADVDPNPRFINGGPGGRGWYVYVQEGSGPLEEVRKKIADALKDAGEAALERDPEGKPAFVLDEASGAPKGLKKLKLTLTRNDAEAEGGNRRVKVRERLASALKDLLAQDPFTAQGRIGPAVAQALKDKTQLAMGISWMAMIGYIAFRFMSKKGLEWRYGIAAVAALVHDALVATAFTSLAGAVVPRAWGLSFEMNLTTMAALLTIIGYSINDTIVIFDRIRENLILMKKNTFSEIVNASVNQTLSRTILTAFTVWISVVVLYFFTMHTGSGIAEFAFPMIIGVIAGTYSTIYIASPIVLWSYRGKKPEPR